MPPKVRPYLVAPLILLLGALPLLRLLGALGVRPLGSGRGATRHALAAMFVFTGTAHFNHRRASMIRMVPGALPNPAALVTLTGGLEFLGAAGLVAPRTARLAGWSLTALLLALFPANVRAAQQAVSIGDKPATPLPFRTLVQALYIALILWSTAE